MSQPVPSTEMPSTSVRFEDLGHQVQEMLSKLKQDVTKMDQLDLELIQCITVKDLARVFDAIEAGNVQETWNALREQLRMRKLERIRGQEQENRALLEEEVEAGRLFVNRARDIVVMECLKRDELLSADLSQRKTVKNMSDLIVGENSNRAEMESSNCEARTLIGGTRDIIVGELNGRTVLSATNDTERQLFKEAAASALATLIKEQPENFDFPEPFDLMSPPREKIDPVEVPVVYPTEQEKSPGRVQITLRTRRVDTAPGKVPSPTDLGDSVSGFGPSEEDMQSPETQRTRAMLQSIVCDTISAEAPRKPSGYDDALARGNVTPTGRQLVVRVVGAAGLVTNGSQFPAFVTLHLGDARAVTQAVMGNNLFEWQSTLILPLPMPHWPSGPTPPCSLMMAVMDQRDSSSLGKFALALESDILACNNGQVFDITVPLLVKDGRSWKKSANAKLTVRLCISQTRSGSQRDAAKLSVTVPPMSFTTIQLAKLPLRKASATPRAALGVISNNESVKTAPVMLMKSSKQKPQY